ncbi:MAG: hypothetical protein V1879_00730 [Pseudomonadota bacterium]
MDSRIVIQYRFIFPHQHEERINVSIDCSNMESSPELSGTVPDWCRLGFHQCPNCPLDAGVCSDCPLALRLVRLIEASRNVLSYEEVSMEVSTPERTVTKQTTAQRALSSLMGLVMATSGCPHMVFLKPMARYHLPLATEEETIFRAVSTYLLDQYFLHKQSMPVDLDLKGLKKIYAEIGVVNAAMAKRLRAISTEDSAINAIVRLDILAKALPYSVEESLEEIRYLFLHPAGDGNK